MPSVEVFAPLRGMDLDFSRNAALEHDLTVVTRNVRHFEDLGFTIFNPWELL